ncbi:hypothetical protein CAC42_8124 [Sphaceloma murrayae]|uniref:Aminoglycoside phosphotransferase domain-containing protein n=1 Tax=Sphaceloma murrayae TaxID=2082308 RepID=A0A2K1QRB6_9PEZI|nr:hypothetical protein CAC42_8124 [Sphaceloma murrayae]
MEFADGVSWLVRIPRQDFSDFPDDMVEYLVASEHATLKFLVSTRVPAPLAFDKGVMSDPSNRTGINYIFMETLPGKPFDPYQESHAVQERVLQAVVVILSELARHPFDLAGSLIGTDSGSVKLGARASTHFVNVGKLRPFKTESAYYLGFTEHYMDLIADGQLHVDYPDIAFRFYSIMRSHVHLMCKRGADRMFYLKHVDDKGDHLMIDDVGKVTGIMYWQFARCVPAYEAFGASYFTANMDELYSGMVQLSENDRALAKTAVGAIVGDRTGTIHTLGPFLTAQDYYTSWIEAHLALIADQQPHVRFATQAYVMYDYLHGIIQERPLVREGIDEARDYYLKHTDDKGDHILVDPETYEVTGYIDWTFARTVPLEEAFGPSLFTADMGAMYDGNPGLSAEDVAFSKSMRKGFGGPNEEVHSLCRAGDQMRRVMFGLATGVDISWEEAKTIFEGLLKSLGAVDKNTEFVWDDWEKERRFDCLQRDPRFRHLDTEVGNQLPWSVG